MAEKQENWFSRHKIITGIFASFGVLFLLIVIAAIIDISNDDEQIVTQLHNTEQPAQETTVTETEKIESTTEAIEQKQTTLTTWHKIVEWEGEAIKNTETFKIPSNEWKISWDTNPGDMGDMNFQIYIYNSAGSLVGVAANVVGANKDSSIMRGAGDYYLTINTAQPYTIIVEAKY